MGRALAKPLWPWLGLLAASIAVTLAVPAVQRLHSVLAAWQTPAARATGGAPRLVRQRSGRSGSWLRVALVLTVCAAAMVYGAMRQWVEPTRLDQLLGQPLQMEASVTASRPVQHGVILDLVITRLQVGDLVQRCQLAAEWPQWGSAASGLSVGERLAAQGMLVKPPVASATGVPIRAWLAQRGIFYSFSGRVLAQWPAPPAPFAHLRTRIDAAVRQVPAGQPGQAALLDNVVFGGGGTPSNVRQAFLAAGLLHVLAASGANLLLVESAMERGLFPVWRRLRLPRRLWSLCLFVFVWLFAGLCSFSPSVLRAACMAGYRFLGAAVGRSVAVSSSLTVAALFISIWQPRAMETASSVLSFVATFALAEGLYVRRRHARPGRSPTVRLVAAAYGWLALSVRTTVIVEVYLLPLNILEFQQLTPYSTLSNLVAEPLLAILMPAGALFIGLAVTLVHVPLLFLPTVWMGRGVYELLTLLQRLAFAVAKWPGALTMVQRFSHQTLWLVVYYAALASVRLPRVIQWKRQRL